MSRTKATERAYLARAVRLYARARQAAEACGTEAPLPTDVVAWLVAQKQCWKASTWRQYKAAMLYLFKFIACNSQSPALLRQGVLDAAALLDAESQTGALRRSTRTSAGKCKRVPLHALGELLANLDTRREQWRWANLTASWIRASLLTGLRPSEWKEAHIERDGGDTTWLVVTNGKNSNGRSNGPTRRLQLGPDRLSAAEIDTVEIHLANLHALSADSTFRQLQDGVRHCLRHAQRHPKSAGKNKPPVLCLYSFRHQFSADAKTSGLTRDEVAALLGHASDATAGMHYARRVSGRTGLGVAPDPSNVASVRPIALKKAQRRMRHP